MTNQLIMAAGQADYKRLKQLITNKVNLKNAISTLSDNGVTLLHIIISTPWRQLEYENESQNENRSLVDHVTSDTDCKKCLLLLANCER